MAKRSKNIITEDDVILTGREREIQTSAAKCPSCGADMMFYPEKQLLKCDYCSAEKQFEIVGGYEKSIDKLFEVTNQWSDETHIYSCNNCGAKQIISKSEITPSCCFCGTSNVVETSELSGIIPNAVVPFTISKDNVLTRIREWVKKKLFAPSAFKNNISAESISGVYSPAFTFDADTLSFYNGRLGKYKYETHTENGKEVTRRRTEYFYIRGSFNMLFDDVLIQASNEKEQKLLKKVQPFATRDSKNYKKEFLHGYSASHYSKDGRQCWGEARTIMEKRIRSGILSKYTYDVIDSLNINTAYRNQTYKYLLLPLYIANLKWKKRLYNCCINGNSGKIVGKTPVSGLKVLILIGGILAGLLVLGLISRFLQ